MNTLTHKNITTLPATLALAALATLALAPLTTPLRAQPLIIHGTTSTTIATADDTGAPTPYRVSGASVEFDIDDNVTLTVGAPVKMTAADTGGSIYNASNTAGTPLTFTVKPTGPDATGTTIFQGLGSNYSLNASKYGGAMYLTTANVTFDITNAVFDKFVAGNDTGSVTQAGVIYAGGASAITMKLTNVAFTNNRSFGNGGVMSLTSASALFKLDFTNVDFSNNTAGTNVPYAVGGALAINGTAGSYLSITNTVQFTGFRNNTFQSNSTGTCSAYGGAIFINTASLKLDGLYFTGNTAAGLANTSNMATSYGGAIYVANVAIGGTVSIRNTNFANNTASMTNNGAGGTYVEGGAIGATYLNLANLNFLIDTGAYTNNLATTTVAGNNTGNAFGGALYLYGATTNTYTLKNLAFTNNKAQSTSASTANAQGGALYISSGSINATNLAFTNNTATADAPTTRTGYGGALYLTTAIATLNGANFEDNTALTSGGALYANAPTTTLAITNGTFARNTAQTSNGGALALAPGVKTTLTDPLFTSNTAAAAGGAIYLTGTNTLTINATTNATSAGNKAATPAGAGFLHAAGANNTINFNIAPNITYTIGSAADTTADTIISTDPITINPDTGNTGALVLNANNTLNTAPINIQRGALYLGNNNAALSGPITIAPGATFGGAGTVATTPALPATATLAAGVPTNPAPGTLTLADPAGLTLAGNTLTFGHLGSGTNDKLTILGPLNTTAGANTINLIGLASGTYTLINATTIGTSSTANFTSLLANGSPIAGRSSATFAFAASSLTVAIAITNTTATWTGADTPAWQNGVGNSWTISGYTTDHNFLSGDKATFDSTADSANTTKRTIAIAPAGVHPAEMDITGPANYTFTGGPITTDTNNTTLTPATTPNIGKLVKTGPGTLTLANTANTFANGIDLSGGTLAFNTPAQLTTGPTAAINILDNATLAPNKPATGNTITLTTPINLTTAKTLTIDTTNTPLTLAAPITGPGNIAKTGPQDLVLAANSPTLTGTTTINTGRLLLAPAATLAGAIAIAPAATLAGAGNATGAITIAPGATIQVGSAATPGATTSATLTLANLKLEGATLAYGLYPGASAGYNNSDRLNLTGALAPTGTNTIDLTGNAQVGTYLLGKNMAPLATAYTGTTIVTLGGESQIPGARQGASLSTSGADLILVYNADVSRAMTWTGNATPNWNISEDNWTNSGTVHRFASGDQVTLNDTGATRNEINIASSAQQYISDITIAGTTTYTITGQGINAAPANMIAGSPLTPTGKLYKKGTGTLALQNAPNYFAGGIEITDGAISFTDPAQLTTSDTATIHFTAPGGALQPATDNMTLPNTLSIATAATAAFDTLDNTLTITGTLTGPGSLAKTGPGTLIVATTDATTYTGTTQITAGTLQLGAPNPLGPTPAIALATGATLDTAGNARLAPNNTYTITAAGNGSITGGFTSAAPGAGLLAFNGTGTTTLTAASASFTGTTLVNTGRLILANAQALGSSQVTIAAPANLNINTTGTFATPIAGTGTLNFTANSTVTGSNTITNIRVDNNANVTAATPAALGGTTTKITLNNGTITAGAPALNLGDITITGNGRLSFSNLATGTLTLNSLASTSTTATLAFYTNLAEGTANAIKTNTITGNYYIRLLGNTGATPAGAPADIPLVIANTNAARYTLVDRYIDLGGMSSYAVTLLDAPGATIQAAPSGNLSTLGNNIVNAAGAAPLTWLAELDTLQKRLGEIRFDTRATPRLDTWLRGYATRLNVKARATGAANASDFHETQYGIETGADYGGHTDTAIATCLGIFAGYGTSTRSIDNAAGDGHASSLYGGLYLTFVMADGWYVDGVLKYNAYTNNFTATATGQPVSANYKNAALGLSIETGRRIKFGPKAGANWYVEPQAQVAVTQFTGVQYTTTNGLPVQLNVGQVTQARLGAELGYTDHFNRLPVQPYVKAHVAQQWNSAGTIQVDGHRYDPQIKNARLTLGAGLNWQIRKTAQFYFDYEYTQAKDYQKPYALTAGIRYQW